MLDKYLKQTRIRKEAVVELFEAMRWDLSAVTDKDREEPVAVCQINHTYSV